MQSIFRAFVAGPYEQQIAANFLEPGTLAGRQAATFALCCAATANDVLLMLFLEWRHPVGIISYAGGTALAAACASDFAHDTAGSYSASSFAPALWLLARGSKLVYCSTGLAGD